MQSVHSNDEAHFDLNFSTIIESSGKIEVA